MSKKNESNSVLQFFVTFVIAALAAIIVFKAMNYDKSNGESRTKIVTVDLKVILQTYMFTLSNKDYKSAEEAEFYSKFKAEEFAAKLVGEIEKFEKKGFVVIERNNILGAPSYMDITNQVAEKLNVKIEYFPNGIRERWFNEYKGKFLQ